MDIVAVLTVIWVISFSYPNYPKELELLMYKSSKCAQLLQASLRFYLCQAALWSSIG